MCHKVTVSLQLFTLNSAEFYIYCVRINRFKARPISAPANFSPCRNLATKVVLAMVIIRCQFQNILSAFFSVVLAWLILKFMVNTWPSVVMMVCGICLSVGQSVSLQTHSCAHSNLGIESERNVILTCDMLWEDCQCVEWILLNCL